MLSIIQRDLAYQAMTTSFTYRLFVRSMRCRQTARGRYWVPAKTVWYTSQEVYGK